MTWVSLSSKYDGKCRHCNGSIDKGDSIYWDTETKKVLHEKCHTSPNLKTSSETEPYDLKDKTPSEPHIYRHGDLCIREVTEFPKSLTKRDTKILAEGEATGHTHTIVGNAQIFENLRNKFLEAFDEVKLVHQEHEQIDIKPGKYIVIIEQEHDPFQKENRSVLD